MGINTRLSLPHTLFYRAFKGALGTNIQNKQQILSYWRIIPLQLSHVKALSATSLTLQKYVGSEPRFLVPSENQILDSKDHDDTEVHTKPAKAKKLHGEES